MPNWPKIAKTALVEIPDIIVTIWLRVYTVILAVGSLVLWAMLVIVLVLWFGFGIRWGW